MVYSVKPDTRNILYRCLPSISIYTYCYFLVAMSLTVHLAFTTEEEAYVPSLDDLEPVPVVEFADSFEMNRITNIFVSQEAIIQADYPPVIPAKEYFARLNYGPSWCWEDIRGRVLLYHLERISEREDDAMTMPVYNAWLVTAFRLFHTISLLPTGEPNTWLPRFSVQSGFAAFCARNMGAIRIALIDHHVRNWNYLGLVNGRSSDELAFARNAREICPGLIDGPILGGIVAAHRALHFHSNDRRIAHGRVWMDIHRGPTILADSVDALLHADAKSLSIPGNKIVRFVGEFATGSGVARDWFYKVVAEIFGPNSVLFSQELELIPNPDLQLFRAAGRILALSVVDGTPTGVPLPKWFFAYILGHPLDLEYISEDDPVLYNSLRFLLTLPDDDLRRFPIEIDGVEYVPDATNGDEMVRRKLRAMIPTTVADQFLSLRNGFNEVLPISEIRSVLSGSDLWSLVVGEPEINVDDLIQHIIFKNGSPEMESWTQQLLRRMTATELHAFLSFTTSRQFAPAGGFENLQPPITMEFVQRSDRLPSSSTCFNLLRIPEITCQETFNQRLLTAITEGNGAMEERH